MHWQSSCLSFIFNLFCLLNSTLGLSIFLSLSKLLELVKQSEDVTKAHHPICTNSTNEKIYQINEYMFRFIENYLLQKISSKSRKYKEIEWLFISSANDRWTFRFDFVQSKKNLLHHIMTTNESSRMQTSFFWILMLTHLRWTNRSDYPISRHQEIDLGMVQLSSCIWFLSLSLWQWQV